MTTPDPPAEIRLKPLPCGACGAAQVLEDVDRLRCPFCQAEVEVPVAYRDALRAAHTDDASRGEARRLYEQLSRPTSRAVKVVAFVFGGMVERVARMQGSLRWIAVAWVLAMNFLLVSLVVILGQFALLVLGGELAHRNLLEALRGGAADSRDIVILGVWVVTMLLGAAIGVYGRRSEVALGSLQAAMAARKPLHERGPAACRTCEGPLQVKPDDVGVRCLYCGADNLVRIPAPVLARFAQRAATAAHTVEEAHASLEAEARGRVRMLVFRLGALSLVLALWIGNAARGAEAHREARPAGQDFPPIWVTHANDPRPFLLRATEPQSHTFADRADAVVMPPHCKGHGPAYPSNGCSSGDCQAVFYVALRRDEHVRIVNLGAHPAKATLSWHRSAAFPRTLEAPFGEESGSAHLAPGAASEIPSTWTGWHEVRVRVEGSPHGDPLGVCLEVRSP